MLQSGRQWRPVGGCFGGNGANQVCSDRGRMSPLSNTQFGTLDDDFEDSKWIFSDFGRVVVNPARPDYQYTPAMPYLQNSFILLQIALQEVVTFSTYRSIYYCVFSDPVSGRKVYFMRGALYQVSLHSIADISLPQPRNAVGDELLQRANSYHISLRLAHLFHVRVSR